MGAGLKLLHGKVRHLGTEENLKILSLICDDLAKSVEMRFQTSVKDLLIENGKISGVILDTGEKLLADHVVLGAGITRGLAQAGASGIYIARNILDKEEDKVNE